MYALDIIDENMLTHQSQPQSIDWEEGGEWDRGSEEGVLGSGGVNWLV